MKNAGSATAFLMWINTALFAKGAGVNCLFHSSQKNPAKQKGRRNEQDFSVCFNRVGYFGGCFLHNF